MKSQDWHAQRAHAERVPCPDCHAPTGRTCRNGYTGRELNGPAAHIARTKMANDLTAITDLDQNHPAPGPSGTHSDERGTSVPE
ncbi:hypothetical protein J1770_gp51 [Gordonia phage EMoore]|uniref:DNA-binding phage zinc finger domain-containing protein n=1 Tax=Gordonia phage EMoore TaxID=2656534 RepID=A0A649VTH9_9CAUD|nr:hypothetical protein J1770_gp51 [Gordonia phage EMoore]QGJ95837.1 hypothetical protein SEA_EMOORE_51 [Gordonia phage EMoore]